MLEVIALDAADASAAEEGGAGRLEVVADMAADGLTPDPGVLAEIRRATSLPLRVMLRADAGFHADSATLARLGEAAKALADKGADGFVFGFLDRAGRVDRAATATLAEAVAPLPWTFHRALDHSADPVADWDVVLALPGLDAVLTAGSPDGVRSGLPLLLARTNPEMIMAGGGLRREHVRPLAEAGVRAFHVGTAVRPDGSWDRPVDAGLVAEWHALVSG